MNTPHEFRAGDTVNWIRDDLTDDYPASDGWQLTYAFVSKAGKFQVVAQPDSEDPEAFALTLSAADSAKIAAGSYSWQATVAKAAERFTVDVGGLEVLPDLGAVAASDQRFWAVIALEAVEAVLGRRATTDQQNYSIGGRSLSRMALGELLELQGHLRGEVRKENKRLKGGRGGKIKFRLQAVT